MGKRTISIPTPNISRRRLIFYAIWIPFQLGIYAYGLWKQWSDPKLSYMNQLGLSVLLSRGAGFALGVNAALLPLSLCRNLLAVLQESPLGNIIPFHEGVFFHTMTAYALLVNTLIHVNAHYVNAYTVLMEKLVPNFEVASFHYLMPSGWTGHLLVLVMVIIYSSSHYLMRKKNFENFWYIHHLFILFFILLWIHPTGCFVKTDPFWKAKPMGSDPNYECRPYYSYVYTGITFAIYLCERILREVRSRRMTVLDKVILHPGDTIEIRIFKPSFRKSYRAGQYIFLCCPSISAHQWHPFTLTSCPEEPFISVHIRVVGGWTKKLGQALGMNAAKADNIPKHVLPTIKVDGPYGAPAQDITKNEFAIMIAGGIGFTPFASVLKSVYYAARKNSRLRLRRIHLFWINRDMEAFEWLRNTLADLENEFEGGSLLKLHLHLTSRISMEMAHNVILNDLDESFDAITGLNSRTEYGRPIWDKEFHKIREEAKLLVAKEEGPLKAKVGVYVCGPQALATVVKRKCTDYSTGSIKFAFESEHF